MLYDFREFYISSPVSFLPDQHRPTPKRKGGLAQLRVQAAGCQDASTGGRRPTPGIPGLPQLRDPFRREGGAEPQFPHYPNEQFCARRISRLSS